MSDFESLPLAEVVDFREGPGIMAADFCTNGVPLVRLAGLKDGADLLTGCNYLDPAKVEKKWSQFQIDAGDVLLSTSASLGKVAVVRESGVGSVPYTGIIRFRPRGSKMLADFIPFALKSPNFKRQVVEMGVGSVINHFGPSHLRKMFLQVPPRATQRAIVEVLSVLEEKATANTQMAAQAKELARLKYLQLLDGNCTPVVLKSILSLEYGKALPAETRQPGHVAVYGSSGIVGKHNVSLVNRAGVVVGRKGTAGSVRWAPNPHFPIDTTYYVRPGDGIPLVFCYFVLQSLRLGQMNSDSAVPGLNRKEAYACSIALPALGQMREFNLVAQLLFDFAAQLDAESDSLAQLRDMLLPELMSGRLRVKDAERIVEEEI